MRYATGFVVLWALGGWTTSSSAQGHASQRRLREVVERELSGPMVVGAQPTTDDLPLYAPGGGRILYRAQILETDENVLISAPSDPDLPAVALSPDGGRSVVGFLWSPDGTRAIFWTAAELFVAPADGSQPALLLHEVPPELPTPFSGVRVSQSGARVLYEYDRRLHGVPITGGTPIVLSGAVTVSSFDSAPGGVVLFNQIDPPELYSVLEGGSAPPLLLALQTGVLDAVGLRGVYRVGNRLWSVPLDLSSPAVPLIPVLPGFATINQYLVSPTTDRVIFRADAEIDGQIELFTARTDGSSAAALEPLLLVSAGGDVEFIDGLTPDGLKVLFRAETGSPPTNRLFSAAVDGSGTVQLHEGTYSDLAISPDSQFAVFRIPRPSFHTELFSISLATGTLQSLAAPFPSGRLAGFQPTAFDVVIKANQGTSTPNELYRVPIYPGGPPPAPVKLNGPLVPDGVVWGFAPAPDGASVTFSATAPAWPVRKLFRAELTGAPDPRIFTTPDLVSVLGDVIAFVARSGIVAYVADQDVNGQYEVYVARAGGSALPVKRSGPFAAGGSVSVNLQTSTAVLDLTPDGGRIVYLADAEVDEQHELFSGPTDGSSPVVKLNGELEFGTSVSAVKLSPDGTRVVYVAHELGRPGLELRSVPVAGGAATLLAAVSAFQSLLIAPDSSRVLFRDTRLYSVPLAGGALLDLSGVVTALPDFEITADSARAVFLAQAASGQPVRLYSRPLAGGTLLTLSSVDTNRFELGEAGARVLFTIDGAAEGQELLHSVPANLGSAAVALHASTLDAVSFSTRGERVLFHVQSPGFPFVDDWRVVALDGTGSLTLPGADQRLLVPGGEVVVLRVDDQVLAQPASGGSPLHLHTLPAQNPFGSLYSFTPDGRVIVRQGEPSDGPFVTVPLTGGPSRLLISAETDFAGGLQFLGPDRWLFLGQRSQPDVTLLLTAGVEQVRTR